MLKEFFTQAPAFLWCEDFSALTAAVEANLKANRSNTQALEGRISLALSTLLEDVSLSPRVLYGNQQALRLSKAPPKNALEQYSLIARAYQGLLREVLTEIWQEQDTFEKVVYWELNGQPFYLKLLFQVMRRQEQVTIFVIGLKTNAPSDSTISQVLEQYELLYKVSQMILTTANVKRFLENTVSLIHHHYESFGTVIALVDVPNRMIQRAFANDREMTREQIDRSLPHDHFWDGLSGWAIRTRETVYSPKNIPDFREASGSMENRERNDAGAVVVVPILFQQQVMGTLTIIANNRMSAFRKHDIQIAEMMANQVAIALKHFELLERAQRMAHTDLLTGLHNRERFLQMAENAFEKAFSQEHALGLIILDVDNFKDINEQHGNAVGDDVLRAIAERISRHLKSKNALISRFDGDEYCVMLPSSSSRSLYKLANELRIAIANEAVTSAPIVVKLTISAGLAHMANLPEGAMTLRDLMSSASQALLEAKAHGRNCVYPQVLM